MVRLEERLFGGGPFGIAFFQRFVMDLILLIIQAAFCAAMLEIRCIYCPSIHPNVWLFFMRNSNHQ
jgi:hypothetical protein